MLKFSIYEEMADQKKRGVLLVLTGPTCAGKDVLIEGLRKKNTNLVRLVTTNSRPKRLEEKEGYDYYFVTKEEFEKMIATDEFFEWVEYRGNYRGGRKKHVEEALKSGHDVVWRIDTKGVKNIKKKVQDMIADPNSPIKHVAFIFLTAPDILTLKRRIEKRGTESMEEEKQSLNLAKWEVEQFDDSDYLVVNIDGKLNEAVEKVSMIIEAERLRTRK